MEKIDYTEFEGGFDQIILEESFVLNLKTTMSFIDFQMEFAINERYPLYTPPEEPDNHNHQSAYSEEEDEYELEVVDDEIQATEASTLIPAEIPEEIKEERTRYSYRRGRLFFPNMEQVRWNSRIQPFIDPASGLVDYGAIDYFYLLDGCYYLAGYWGEIEVISGKPILEIDELKNLPKPQKSPEDKTVSPT